MSVTEIIEEITDGKMTEFMNSPVEPDGQAYIQTNYKDNRKWVHCPYCGKKQFPIDDNTVIKNFRCNCKGSKCKREFVVNT